MCDDGIRPALTSEAEELSDIAWQSEAYWEHSTEFMNAVRSVLNITQEFIENNPVYVMEDEEEEEKIGFFALEHIDGKLWLRHLWVMPNLIGCGFGGKMLLAACETAEVMGADYLYISSGKNAEEFYIHMGAEKTDEKESEKIPGFMLSIMRIKL